MNTSDLYTLSNSVQVCYGQSNCFVTFKLSLHYIACTFCIKQK